MCSDFYHEENEYLNNSRTETNACLKYIVLERCFTFDVFYITVKTRLDIQINLLKLKLHL